MEQRPGVVRELRFDLDVDDRDGHVGAGRQRAAELASPVERDRVEATVVELGDDGVALRLRQQECDDRPAVRRGHPGQPSASGSRAVTWTTPSAVLVTRAAKPGMVGTASRKETSGSMGHVEDELTRRPGCDGHALHAGEAAEVALEARDAGDGDEARHDDLGGTRLAVDVGVIVARRQERHPVGEGLLEPAGLHARRHRGGGIHVVTLVHAVRERLGGGLGGVGCRFGGHDGLGVGLERRKEGGPVVGIDGLVVGRWSVVLVPAGAAPAACR